MIRTFLAAVVLLLAMMVTPADAKDYRADRFDVRIVTLDNGAIRVTETIVFRFLDGTFTKVSRVVPTRRTDGVELVSASMDGTPFAVGDGPGFVRVRRKNGLNVEWRFPTIGASTHTFELTYVVRGVAQSSEAGDLLAWQALPTKHDYTIAASTVEIDLPTTPSAPVVRTRRVGEWQPTVTGTRVAVTSQNIGKNGWLEVAIHVPAGTLLATAPVWQQRNARHQSYRNRMLLISGGLVFAGIVLLLGFRQSYDAPPGDVSASTAFSGPPEALPPALAGALARNGSVQLEHALAALFDLASRGVIQVKEERGGWGTRTFFVERGGAAHGLRPHEQAVLENAFGASGAETGRIPLSRARSQLASRLGKVRKAVDAELLRAGLLDVGRKQVRDRYYAVAAVFFVLSLAAILGVVAMLERLGPWLIAVPVALMVLAIAAVIFGGAHTPLTNDGVRRAAQWRAYRRHLQDVPRDAARREASPSGANSAASLLPLAVALGLAVAWSKLFRHGAAPLPAWFHAASAADANRAFVAFVGTGGASHGGGGAGSGAAGGGSSGAS